MKTIKLSEKKAEREGKTTPYKTVNDMLNRVENGHIKDVVMIARQSDDTVLITTNDMEQTHALGLIECGKQLILDDVFYLD